VLSVLPEATADRSCQCNRVRPAMLVSVFGGRMSRAIMWSQERSPATISKTF